MKPAIITTSIAIDGNRYFLHLFRDVNIIPCNQIFGPGKSRAETGGTAFPLPRRLFGLRISILGFGFYDSVPIDLSRKIHEKTEDRKKPNASEK